MRFLPVLLLLGAAGYLAWDKLKPAPPPPPPPPPPPAILSEPTPVVNEQEQAKILKSAEDPDPEVRWEAIVLLDKMKAPAAQPLMFKMVEKDMDPSLRVRILGLLSGRHGPEVTQAVAGAMRDPEPEVRIAALRGLEKIGDYSVAPLIAGGPVKDSEDSVRLQALKTLNILQDKKEQEIAAARARYEEQKAAAEKAAQQKR